MPLVLPPFAQYQQPLVPLRGLWKATPPEGDKFVSCELDWLVGNPGAIALSLSGNSPVTISQIVALYVDNSRCGSDVSFQFPDTGFELVVDAGASGLFPVLTNALNFYAVALNPAATDVTICQILNSMPPLVAIPRTASQQRVAAANVSLAAGTTVILAAGPTANGTLQTLSIFGTADTAGSALAGH